MQHTRFALTGSAVALALFAGGCSSAQDTAAESAPVAAVPAGQVVAAPSKAQIAKLFTEWNAALATGDSEAVADHYAPDAVLLPTVSNKVRNTRAEIVDYFDEFLKKKPQGKITSSYVKVLNANEAIDAGTYDFTLTEQGEQKVVAARYTFVYELVSGKWLIVNHHSSVMPEG